MHKRFTTVILAFIFLVCTGTFSFAAPNTPSSALIPGDIRVDASINHIGVVWWIDGDTNLNSSFSLEFRRQGTSNWLPAAPGMRTYPNIIVDGSALNLNYWAASALFLESVQTYDLRLTLTDPDGGGNIQTRTAVIEGSNINSGIVTLGNYDQTLSHVINKPFT